MTTQHIENWLAVFRRARDQIQNYTTQLPGWSSLGHGQSGGNHAKLAQRV